jgi:hypothetical protein
LKTGISKSFLLVGNPVSRSSRILTEPMRTIVDVRAPGFV